MARMSLWTPLLLILVIQLAVLLYVNLRTSSTADSDRQSLHISTSDRINGGSRLTPGSKAAGADVEQVGAPASVISRERWDNGKTRE